MGFGEPKAPSEPSVDEITKVESVTESNMDDSGDKSLELNSSPENEERSIKVEQASELVSLASEHYEKALKERIDADEDSLSKEDIDKLQQQVDSRKMVFEEETKNFNELRDSLSS